MKSFIRSVAVLELLALTLIAVPWAQAHEDCCQSCGCKPRLRKVCRLICETEEVAETKFDCECEHFCIPGPSEKCGVDCECDCRRHHGKSCRTIWKPSQSGEVRTRKKLVIKEEKKEVPKYRWVVEYVCDECGCGSNGHQLAADEPAPSSEEPASIPQRRSITQVLFGH